MRLKNILYNLEGVKKIDGKTSLEIIGLSNDSKAVKDSFLFAAVRGQSFDGADFIDEAVDRGAKAVILEFGGNKSRHFKRGGVTYIYVDDARKALSRAAMSFYGDVSNKMRLVGVTGTNGKTTITYLLENLFKVNSEKTGIIGTINYRFGHRIIPASNTTPGVLDIYSLLSSMYKEGSKNCVLEVSSHSLDQGRVDTLNFDIAIFTNLTREHLDYHKNLEDYLAAKIILFSKIKQGGYAIINKDDPASEKIIEKVTSEKKARVITYGIEQKSDIFARNIKYSYEGLIFEISVAQGSFFHIENSIRIESRLIGRHNVYNILASVACGIAMGMGVDNIREGVRTLSSLPGRLEKIDCGQNFAIFVDYAHTENGIENALKALKDLEHRRLLVVFGCGGNRDKSKRPKMGRISSELSDKIFITSDNPRSEDPKDITNQIIEGIDKDNYVVEIDRFEAIKKALKEARQGDIVLVAGKGHETYQIFKDTTVPFDDREVVRRLLLGDGRNSEKG